MEEIPQRIERDMTPEQNAAAEDLAEKRGISIDMAERAILGIRVEETEPVATPKAPHKPRASRRGRGSYSEKSGRDVSREMANQYAEEHPTSPEEQQEQRAVNERGAEMARRALRAARSDRQA